ncbi:hypothetical protein P152DRAFT_448110 [Eremomyces bilateralis CBS 781.70]|uniref:Uncharacterized protein n=1 Tax=Eremomyces bilateralis CBS 781.70 TaxID=1392243 RepID=A0A6G1G6H4_9PEZI|nr:uncharacterized protein P152DRAFT_448110 [Eremomyces bilateralis CBS 781.70]KAF1813695.1 hypothetical protein P152DRAFT_448110 [Eremomyces bilateralis CBS 781.70]
MTPSVVGTASPRARWSRVTALHENVRSMLFGSSVYSQSPTLRQDEEPPKLPPLVFLRQPNTRTEPSDHARGLEEGIGSAPARNHANNSHNYPTNYSPASIPSTWERSSLSLARGTTQGSSTLERTVVDSGADGVARGVRRKRRKQKQKPKRGWVRNHHQSPIFNRSLLRGRTRTKAITLMISGVLLATMLTIYLALALTNNAVAQEVHILFILLLICTTIVFCHALIRLCMLATRPPPTRRHHRVPDLAGPQGFEPKSPIRVHVARDDEEAVESVEEVLVEEKDAPKPPPPAYGLWRCSVRLNPNLLHWQRVDALGTHAPGTPTPATPTLIDLRSPSHSNPNSTHRPPSYVSDDGVDYVVSVQPRSTVHYSHVPSPLPRSFGDEGQTPPIQEFRGPLNSHVPEFIVGLSGAGRPPSQIHPAWRT